MRRIDEHTSPGVLDLKIKKKRFISENQYTKFFFVHVDWHHELSAIVIKRPKLDLCWTWIGQGWPSAEWAITKDPINKSFYMYKEKIKWKKYTYMEQD